MAGTLNSIEEGSGFQKVVIVCHGRLAIKAEHVKLRTVVLSDYWMPRVDNSPWCFSKRGVIPVASWHNFCDNIVFIHRFEVNYDNIRIGRGQSQRNTAST